MILIKDTRRSAAMNMALDELLFSEYQNEPVLRVYRWDGAYTTVGYFQKASEIKDKNFIRRFTGGLTVSHENDISYCFVASSEKWPFVYSQGETYKQIHSVIRKALSEIGFQSDMLSETGKNINNICVDTLYENDLVADGKKILGSCLRRRGGKIFVQGSVHINTDESGFENFAGRFGNYLAASIGENLNYLFINPQQEHRAAVIAREKYLKKEWNHKF